MEGARGGAGAADLAADGVEALGAPQREYKKEQMVDTESESLPTQAWVNGRETSEDSLDYGEVVVSSTNVWNQPGDLTQGARAVGSLSHSTRVNVVERAWDEENETYYYRVSRDEIEGWMKEVFLCFKWSYFTFFGTLVPARPCADLETRLQFRGMTLLLKQSRYAMMVEGDPSHLNSIQTAALRFINRVLVAVAPITAVTLRVEPANWVEIPISSGVESTTVGFATSEERQWTITQEDIEKASVVVSLMASVPYLDLALNDYYHALDNPQHALIFLARAIESVESSFSSIAKQKKGVGKEQVMRDMLGLEKSDVEYVTRRANASHRRHAARDARATPLPESELTECFGRTAKIIVTFADFLEASGF